MNFATAKDTPLVAERLNLLFRGEFFIQPPGGGPFFTGVYAIPSSR